jgi:hypothetical protein
MPATKQRVESFAVEDGHLVRRVVPLTRRVSLRETGCVAPNGRRPLRRVKGDPYEHRCSLDRYRELVWAAIDLAAGGFTIDTLVEQVRNRPREKHDNSPAWVSFTNAAVATAFWKDRGIIDTRCKRNYVDDDGFFEDAMIEFHFLEANG